VADKNTIIGISLIAVILIVFNFINKPTQEEIDKAKAQQEQLAEQQKIDSTAQLSSTSEKKPKSNNTKLTDFSDAYMSEAGQIFVLENDLIRVEINERGARVGNVYLKKYKTYSAFAKNIDEPLQLMSAENNVNELKFVYNGVDVYTRNLRFEVQKQTANSLVLRISKGEDKFIEYNYTLAPIIWIITSI
jgi:YidC/Oxa1 family membrane protein insertase